MKAQKLRLVAAGRWCCVEACRLFFFFSLLLSCWKCKPENIFIRNLASLLGLVSFFMLNAKAKHPSYPESGFRSPLYSQQDALQQTRRAHSQWTRTGWRNGVMRGKWMDPLPLGASAVTCHPISTRPTAHYFSSRQRHECYIQHCLVHELIYLYQEHGATYFN